jgi:IclR family acetate operon transcriptional repressor
VQSVDRAIDVLDLLGDAGPDGLALGDVASALGTSKSTAFALLRTLVSREVVADTGSGRSRRYRLGLALARLGDQALAQISVLDLAMPELRALTDETGLTSRVGVLQDGYVIIIGRVEGPGVVRFRSNLARREFPHSTAIGKAILSQLTEDAVRDILDETGLPMRTGNTITSAKALIRDLARVRSDGYALDDEEDNLGVLCIGVPVFDHTESCVAAISVTGLKPAMKEIGVPLIAGTVTKYASEISGKLGLSAGAGAELVVR